MKKEILRGSTIWDKSGNPLTNYTINYYLFGILIHSVTLHNITRENAIQMKLKKI